MAHTQHEHISRLKINRRLIFGIVLNSSFVVIELVTALIIGSLALLSDAGHNFADSFALILALFAALQARKLPTERKTFGFLRTGVLAALLNSTILVLITIYIFYEAYLRILEPPKLPGGIIMIVAGLGLVINSIVAFRFRGQKDINIRAAFLHLITDAAVSLGVLMSGFVILTTGVNLIDPLISLFIGAFILYSTYGITREAIDILMEAIPKGIDVDGVIADILREKRIKNVHHMHIWEIGSGVPALSCHIVVDDMNLDEAGKIISDLELKLAEDYGIIHPTIQVETTVCEAGGICKLPHV